MLIASYKAEQFTPHAFVQVLITSNDLTHSSSQRNLLNTMNALLSMKVVPVLNGNDVVAPAPQIGSDLENVSEASVLSFVSVFLQLFSNLF